MSEPRSSNRGPIQFYDAAYGFMFIWGLYSVIRHWNDANHLTYSFLGGVVWLTLGAFALFAKYWTGPIKEAQRKAAKNILEFQKAIYSSEPYEYRMVSPSEFPELDHDFYDRMRSSLESQGFRFLGDRENATLSRVAPDKRTFLRTMVNADGTICGAAWHRRLNRPFRSFATDIKSIEFESELSDGTFVTTSNNLESARSLPFPGIEAERFPSETSADELLRVHRERLARVLESRPHLSPTKLQTMEDVIWFQRRQQMIKAKHKQSIGYASVESVEKALGRPLGTEQRTFAAEIKKLSESERLANESGPSLSR
jgi:hypothetical protein